MHEVVRKCALMGLLIFLPPTSRATVGILICVVCCCTLNYFQPHRNRLVLFVSQMSFFMSTFKYVCAVFLRINDLNDDDQKVMGWILVVLDVVFMVASVVVLVWVIVLLRAIGAESVPGNEEVLAVKVVPSQQDAQDEREEQQQRSMLHQEILALKWQKNIRRTLMKNTQVVPATTANMPSRVKSTRTRKVEEIEKNHQSYRNMAVRNIQQQQVQRRNSLQLRVQARNVKRGRTNIANRALETTMGGELMDDKAAAVAATLVLDQTKKHVERIETLRLALCKVVKTPAKFQNWLKKNDKASNGLLSRVDFGKVIGKVAQRVGEKGEVAESLMEAIWVSVKEGSGKEVALNVVEHQVVARWVFGN
jgi:hypothetical protein